MPGKNQKEKNMNKVKDAVDTIVSKARDKDKDEVSIHIDLITSLTGVGRSTLYNYGIYYLLRSQYNSVRYVKNNGRLIVECEEWVEERKEERKKRADNNS